MNIFNNRLTRVLFVVAFNIVAVQILLELGLKLVMIPVWPSYFLPHNYPFSQVKTTAGTVSASWTLNSQGFHDIEHEFGKITAKTRIVTIGDSFLAGPQQEPLPILLNSNLLKHRDNIEVINLSRPGIDTNKYYLLLKHALAAYQPDVVLLFIYEGNDFRAMEHYSPELYEQPASFFERHPQASYYGSIFPRSSIFLSDILRNRFIHQWSQTPENSRWGRPHPKRNLQQISSDIAEHIEIDREVIYQFLSDKLTPEELDELTGFGVRIDLLAYMISRGLDAKFTSKLGVKEYRPEVTSKKIETDQVESVHAFIKTMNNLCSQKNIEFYSVLIPTSYIDPDAQDMYTRLGAGQDPLFVKTRQRQIIKLQQLLTDKDSIKVIDLRNQLEGKPGTYLKFDTHWNTIGAKMSADYVSEYLIEHSKKISPQK